jgi:acetyl-CoA synthetase
MHMAIYEKYVGRSRDNFYTLEDLNKNFKLTYNDDFNFAYDVLDYLGTNKPDKLAMVWVGNNGDEKYITFREMMLASNKAANYFKSIGIKKGDFVLLVLKRSYLFWYCMMGLHKIGAIAVQATNMLTAKDYIYRCNAGGIKMAIITGDGDCTRRTG